MYRLVLLSCSILVLLACRDQANPNPVEPNVPSGPSFAISDGAHGSGGNPDFFFRPPMVPDASGDPDYTPGAFNPNLSPTVVICALNVPNNASEATVNALAPPGCNPTGYSVTFSGNQVAVSTALEQYQVDWKIPNSPVTYYRILVYVGSTLLGFADVKTASTGSASNFVVRKDGSQLPIKFRIEGAALCGTAGACSSGTIDPDVGGTVFFIVNGVVVGGVTVPDQGEGGDPITFTLSFCENADLPIDLPQYGDCIHILTDPEGIELTIPGEVFICTALAGLPPDPQDHLVTLHRYDGEIVQALPHSPGSCPPIITAVPSFSGMVSALAQADWKAVARHAAGLLSPQPLYARSMFIDVGRGGQTGLFSDFRYALPAKMEIQSGDNQSGTLGAPLAAPLVVLVTDLNDDPVQGAKVTFVPTDGTVSSPSTVTTGVDGLAQVTWTLPSEGSVFFLTAGGRGIASPNNNGPRGEDGESDTFFDPFMAIQSQFNPNSDPIPSPLVPATLGTGSLFFTANTGIIESPALRRPPATGRVRR